jgi:transcriptional regulator with XRE-family HTH domain
MIGKRIKEIRETANEGKLSQAQFGALLGVSRDVVANIETGRVEPTQIIINAICREFHINETWLRTGDGEPHDETTDDKEKELSRFLGNAMTDDPPFRRWFISMLARLETKHWDAIYDMAVMLREEQEKEEAAKAAAEAAPDKDPEKKEEGG